MPFLPASLFGRLFTALLGVVIITLVIIATMIVRERRDLAFLGTGAWNTTKAIADTSTSLAKLSGSERDAAVEQLRKHPLVLDDLRRRRPTPRPAELRANEHAFAAQVRRQLGPGYGVDVARASSDNTEVIRVELGRWFTPETTQAAQRTGLSAAPARSAAPAAAVSASAAPAAATALPPTSATGTSTPAVSSASASNSASAASQRPRVGPPPAPFNWLYDVTVTLPDGGRVMYRMLAPLPAPPLPRRIFVELGVLTALLGLALFVMTRTITRPLRDLATAADAVGRGANHPQLEEKGARELRRATRAFNTMQERLHRYLDSRTRVVAAMSHDMRTALTRLRLRAESIENDDLRVRFAADLDEMAQMVRGALGLFSSLNNEEPLDAVDVDALLATLSGEFAEQGGQVLIEGRTHGPVSARPLALKRCFTNLLQNAVKYGTRATVHVSDGEDVVVRIRDEGPGIPAESLDQVFEPYFRVEPSRNRDTGGTGLGLSIARDIAQAHGGSIVLRNMAPGRGLEVVVTLPRAVISEPMAAPRSLSRPATEGS